MSEREINICAGKLGLWDTESWMEILSRIEIDGRARTSVVVSYSLVGRSVLSAFNGATMIGESDIIAANVIIIIIGQA